MASAYFLAFFSVIFGLFGYISGIDIPNGSITVSEAGLEKLLAQHSYVVVKFDEAYPYGDKQDQFKKLAEDTISQSDLIIVEFPVEANEEDKTFEKHAKQFVGQKNKLPFYKLFQKGKKPVFYAGEIKNDLLKQFISSNTGLWLGLKYCIEKYDKLTASFMKTESVEERKNILELAENELSALETNPDKISAKAYIKMMEKIIEKGKDFIMNEVKRVKKLSNGKISEIQKEHFKSRLNILTSFRVNLKKRDEL